MYCKKYRPLFNLRESNFISRIENVLLFEEYIRILKI